MRTRISVILSLLLASAFLTGTAAAASFPDVEEYADYAQAVEYVNECGIMMGDENGNFNPHQSVTRAEMATILCNLLGESADLSPDGTRFSDVPASHWANPYVAQAAERGLVAGYGGGLFGPEDDVTYEQAVTMLVNALGFGQQAAQADGYPDGYLAAAADLGLLSGVSAQKGEPLSRADIAALLYNSAYQAGIFEAE